MAEQDRALTTDAARAARAAGTARAAGEAVAVGVGAAYRAGATGAAGAACPAGPAGAGQQAAIAAVTTVPAEVAGGTRHYLGGANPASPASTAVTEQPGTPAVTAVTARRTRPAVAAVAPQNAARPAGLAGPRRPVGAVADQRTPQQRLGRRIHRSQRTLLHGLHRRSISRLHCRIRTTRPAQRLHEPGMKHRGLCAKRLKLPSMRTKQRRNLSRHLIGGRSRDPGGRRRRHRVRRTNPRPNTGQIRSR